MSGEQLADVLFFRTWWVYGGGNPSWIEAVLHGFNLFEGAMWVLLSGLVLRRFLKHRHSALEVTYAAAFFTFGLTDFREAYTLQSWLIWLKVANLAILLWLRATIIGRYHPSSKLY